VRRVHRVDCDGGQKSSVVAVTDDIFAGAGMFALEAKIALREFDAGGLTTNWTPTER
jgi:hypothetical protein